MDADVVPGSVTDWTVTLEDQRRLKWAMVRLRLRSWAYWVSGLVLPVLIAGLFWFALHDPAVGSIPQALELGITVSIGAVFMALAMSVPLATLPGRVEREYPVGATLTAWASEAGLGVRTLRRLTLYPWSRLTDVDVGPVFVRCRQEGQKTLAVPAYLPSGPDEVARSVDFPVQLIGPEIRRELAMRVSKGSAQAPMAEEQVVVDRPLRWRLVRAWLRAQFGISLWLYPAAVGLNLPIQVAIGSYRLAIAMTVMAALSPIIWLLAGEGRMSGMYPVGATVGGSVGEWLEIQGPWGSVAWHHTWLKLRRWTKHTVTYEMVQVGPGGMPSVLTNADKRIVVIPRAFLDAPTPAASAEA
ncbi:hypothetical protein UG56_024340 [Nocardioides luteus]|uniref:Uncharacterized protein n=1 Tax=Nocardioides luteus TaxID=1844 RepID=A0A1J4N0U9_9ACTN|nr:hypothetical protein UG56_024340 [Nocardioides luteus]